MTTATAVNEARIEHSLRVGYDVQGHRRHRTINSTSSPQHRIWRANYSYSAREGQGRNSRRNREASRLRSRTVRACA